MVVNTEPNDFTDFGCQHTLDFQYLNHTFVNHQTGQSSAGTLSGSGFPDRSSLTFVFALCFVDFEGNTSLPYDSVAQIYGQLYLCSTSFCFSYGVDLKYQICACLLWLVHPFNYFFFQNFLLKLAYYFP